LKKVAIGTKQALLNVTLGNTEYSEKYNLQKFEDSRSFVVIYSEYSQLTLAIMLVARLLAAKPHSCDVERLVSAYNILKDDDRWSLNARTIDAHLHIRLNMPVLSKFDVRPAVRAWFTNAD